MYYEVYADVLFVENLWMNAMLLLLTAWADHARVRKGRIAAAAAAGSFGACILTIGSAWISGIFYFLGNLVLAFGMVRITFGEKRHLGIRTLLLYAECFVMNGILRYLGQFHRLGGVWFLGFSSISFLFLSAMEYLWKQRQKSRAQVVVAVLRLGSSQVSVEGLYDTGNSLCDPVSGKPVSILCGDVLDGLLKEAEKECLPRMVPYRTISQSGILEAYFLDSMELMHDGDTRLIEHPLVARMPKMSEAYKLILHRDLLSS